MGVRAYTHGGTFAQRAHCTGTARTAPIITLLVPEPPTYRSMHDQCKTAWVAEFRTMGPGGVLAGAVGCKIQQPRTWWWKPADFSHSMCTAQAQRAHSTRCAPTQKALHTQGGAYTRRCAHTRHRLLCVCPNPHLPPLPSPHLSPLPPTHPPYLPPLPSPPPPPTFPPYPPPTPPYPPPLPHPPTRPYPAPTSPPPYFPALPPTATPPYSPAHPPPTPPPYPSPTPPPLPAPTPKVEGWGTSCDLWMRAALRL